MITVCIGIYNRTSNLLNCLVASMNDCVHKDQLALSVYDCNSTDVPDLKSEIQKVWKGRLVYGCEDRKFSKTYAINQAVCQSDSNKIFVCDVDMTLSSEFVEVYNKFVRKNTVWFPICFSLLNGKERRIAVENGWWRGEGFGMVGILKENYESLGSLDLRFTNWGEEDDDFFVRAHVDFKVIRRKCPGLFHNWHPPDEIWGGRSADEGQLKLANSYHKTTKDLTLRGREILFEYVYKLISSGRRSEARKVLIRKYLFVRYRRWWRMWFNSLVIK